MVMPASFPATPGARRGLPWPAPGYPGIEPGEAGVEAVRNDPSPLASLGVREIVTATNDGGSTVAVSSATGPIGTVTHDRAMLRSALGPQSKSTVRTVLRSKG